MSPIWQCQQMLKVGMECIFFISLMNVSRFAVYSLMRAHSKSEELKVKSEEYNNVQGSKRSFNVQLN